MLQLTAPVGYVGREEVQGLTLMMSFTVLVKTLFNSCLGEVVAYEVEDEILAGPQPVDGLDDQGISKFSRVGCPEICD